MQQAYLELKLSWELFQKAPDTLSEPEKQRLGEIAGKQSAIEQRILSSPETAQVVVPAATLATRLAEIRQRYKDHDDYVQDLERLGLTAASLGDLVERELRVEAVLEKAAASVDAATLVDAEIYYRLHPEAFDRPPTRRLRHILITYSNNSEKAKALSTLEKLRSTLKTPEQFAAAALRSSQCPTAIEGGVLGVVKLGQLYSELEPAAFALAQHEISAVLESPIGLHILRCDEIFPSGMLPFAEVSERITEHLNDQRRRQAQRDWIKQLFASKP